MLYSLNANPHSNLVTERHQTALLSQSRNSDHVKKFPKVIAKLVMVNLE